MNPFLLNILIVTTILFQDKTPTGSNDLPVFLLISEKNVPRITHLGTIESSEADLLDVEAGWFKVPYSECLALIREDTWMPRPSRMRAVCRDGQVFPGSFIGGDRDAVLVRHPWMNEIRIPLEEIARIELSNNTVSSLDPDQDHLILRNGDVLTGFIDSISETVVIEVTREDVERFDIPINRVSEIRLSAEPLQPSWPRVWFVDGLEMTIPSISIEESGHVEVGRHEFMTTDYDRFAGIDELVAVVFDGDRFSPLSNLPIKTRTIDPARRTNRDPKRLDQSKSFGVTDLLLTGPVQHEFEIKSGCNNFRTVVERPRNSVRWSAPTLRILVDNEVVWNNVVRERMSIDLDFPDQSKRIVMEITCGSNGPIHCGLILRDPVVSRISNRSTIGNGDQLIE